MSTLPSQIVPPPAAAFVAPVATRKRRRRAPTSGAADDCFACRKRDAKCDRRRPYCTQCLSIGKECSGYKTQLTWGVGVASRGKLRGLSLPIAKKNLTAAPERPRARGSFSSIAESVESPQQRAEPQERSTPETTVRLTGNVTNYDFVNMDPTGSSATSARPSPALECQQSGPFDQIDALRGPLVSVHQGSFPRQTLHLHTPTAGPFEDIGLPTSDSSISGYSESDFSSPVDFPQTPEDLSYVSAPLSMYNSFQTQYPHIMGFGTLAPFDGRSPTSHPVHYGYGSSLDSSISSDTGPLNFPPCNALRPEPIGPCSLSDILYDDELADGGVSNTNDIELGFGCGIHVSNVSREPLTDESSSCWAVTESSSKHPSTLRSVPSQLKCESFPPRIKFLLYHYDQVLCPAMTAIDGPENPYRAHILQLAMRSESLRCAIAAFSLSNLRRRRRNANPSQQHAFPLTNIPESDKESGREGNNTPTLIVTGDGDADFALIPEATNLASEPTPPEETDFKKRSIDQLNKQLADQSCMKDDAVLATLLILCSYHLCETGVAQFRTQFAGVKKLLGLRKSGVQTGLWGWMETLFTWFDAMTATVNDREAQLRGGYLEMVALATNYRSLENLAGCEGRLFKIIAQLGRLNMLSQRRPVLDPLNNLPRARNLPPATTGPSNDHNARYPYSLNYYEPNDNPSQGTQYGSGENDDDKIVKADDGRPEFWKEWKDLRASLRSWVFRSSITAPEHVLSPAMHDLRQISEAFRATALLYTERVAQPQLPRTSSRFQSLVTAALLHIGRIPVSSGVNKFLLWPLFIAGSECVDQVQRRTIRQRCLDIQKESGFFNNISSLEILEKIWREDRPSSESALAKDGSGGNGGGGGGGEIPTPALGHNAFSWRKAMGEIKGEYCMV